MNMRKSLLLGSLTATLLISTNVLAADIEPMPEAFDWTGFYIGAAGGYAWGKFEASTQDDPTHPLEEHNGDIDNADGWLLGGTIGYNHQIDSFVLGVEADGFWSDVNEDVNTDDEEFHLDLDWLATVRARAGFAFDRFLPYITGGLALGGIQVESFDNVAPPDGDDESNTHVGWTVGAGIEVAVTDNVTIKGEYNFVDLGTEEYDMSDTSFFGDEDVDFEAHIVKVGVNWLFH